MRPSPRELSTSTSRPGAQQCAEPQPDDAHHHHHRQNHHIWGWGCGRRSEGETERPQTSRPVGPWCRHERQPDHAQAGAPSVTQPGPDKPVQPQLCHQGLRQECGARLTGASVTQSNQGVKEGPAQGTNLSVNKSGLGASTTACTRTDMPDQSHAAAVLWQNTPVEFHDAS